MKSKIKKENLLPTCVICDRETFKDSNKCLFHIDKSDWYTNHANNKTWDNNLVTMFWKEIRNVIMCSDKDTIDCTHFIFPKFEVSNTRKQLVMPSKNVKYNECIIAPFDFNFWKKDTKVGFQKNITFLNSIFLDDASFSALSTIFQEGMSRPIFYKDISFQNTKFFGLADFRNIHFKGITDFRFFECEEADFSACIFPNLFFLDNSKVFKSLNISGNGIANISMNGLEVNNFNLNIDNDKSISYFKSIEDGSTQKQDLNLYGMKFSGNVIINDNSNGEYIKELFIKKTSFLSSSTLTLSNFNLKTLQLVDIINLSSLITIRNIRVQNELIFQNLSFQNTEFIDFFANAKNCNVIMTQITILKSKFVNFKINSINRNHIGSSRVIYQQIKSAYDFQKDYINANEYYAKEMGAYQEEVFKSKPWQNLMDKSIFWFGKTVSNFSQNWFMALMWIILIGLYFNFVYYEDMTSINNGLLVSLIAGLSLDYLYLKKRMMNINFILWMPLIYLIVTYLSLYGLELECLSRLVSHILPIKFDIEKDLILSSTIHKVIFGLIFYQLLVSLRRQTKR